MILRTIFTVLALLVLTPLAMGGEVAPWDETRFAAMQAEGRPILIHVTAPWCPTCRAQRPIVSELASAPEYADLTVFDIDFDSQKDLLRRFNVRQQSTLIAFRGAEERGRAVGITDRAAIAALVAETR